MRAGGTGAEAWWRAGCGLRAAGSEAAAPRGMPVRWRARAVAAAPGSDDDDAEGESDDDFDSDVESESEEEEGGKAFHSLSSLEDYLSSTEEETDSDDERMDSDEERWILEEQARLVEQYGDEKVRCRFSLPQRTRPVSPPTPLAFNQPSRRHRKRPPLQRGVTCSLWVRREASRPSVRGNECALAQVSTE
jgi:hypothetical protein